MKNRDKVIIGTVATFATVGLAVYLTRGSRKPKPSQTGIDPAELQFRRELIKGKVDYRLELIFVPGSGEYQGQVEVGFELDSVEDTWLDFHKPSIDFLEVNGKAVDVTEKILSGNRLFLSAKGLVSGQNSIKVRFSNAFDLDGFGMVRRVHRDGESVAMVLGEGNSPLVFPCFDQPDVRGMLKLRVLAAKAWATAANEKALLGSGSSLVSGFLTEGSFEGSCEKSFIATKQSPPSLFGLMAGNLLCVKAKKSFKGVFPEFYIRPELEPLFGPMLPDVLTCVVETLDLLSTKISRYAPAKIAFGFADISGPGVPSQGIVLLPEALIFGWKTAQGRAEALFRVACALASAWFGYVTSAKKREFLALQNAIPSFLALETLSKIAAKLENPILDPEIFAMATLPKRAVLLSNLPSAVAVDGESLPPLALDFVAEALISHRGAWALRSLSKLLGESRIWEIIKEWGTFKTWGSVDLADLSEGLSEFERNALEALFSEPKIATVRTERAHNKLRILAGEAPFQWERVTFVEGLRGGSNSRCSQPISLKPAHEIQLSPGHEFYLVNPDLRGVFVVRDCEANVRSVLKNSDCLSDSELLAYCTNLGLRVILHNELAPLFGEIALKLLDRKNLIDNTHSPIDLVETVIGKFAREEERREIRPKIFAKLREIGAFGAAIAFAESPSDLQSLETPTPQPLNPQETANLWLKKIELGVAKAVPDLEGPASEVARALLSEEEVRSLWRDILFRSEKKTPREYAETLRLLTRNAKPSLRLFLALNFLENGEDVAEKTSSRHFLLVLKEVFPDHRVQSADAIQAKAAQLLKALDGKPELVFALKNRIELFTLFNR